MGRLKRVLIFSVLALVSLFVSASEMRVLGYYSYQTPYEFCNCTVYGFFDNSGVLRYTQTGCACVLTLAR